MYGPLAIIVALAAPVGAYLVAARRFSGKIETSDAKDLWKEAASLRKWSMERIQQLEARIEALEKENQGLRGKLNA